MLTPPKRCIQVAVSINRASCCFDVSTARCPTLREGFRRVVLLRNEHNRTLYSLITRLKTRLWHHGAVNEAELLIEARPEDDFLDGALLVLSRSAIPSHRATPSNVNSSFAEYLTIISVEYTPATPRPRHDHPVNSIVERRLVVKHYVQK
jgi:hypothetical protein